MAPSSPTPRTLMDGLASLRSGPASDQVFVFSLESGDEALNRRVVPAVAVVAHAAEDPGGRESLLIVAASVLAAAIGMAVQFLGRPPLAQGRIEGSDHQRAV